MIDELTHYIFHNYPHLMTVREAAAYKSILGEKKAESSDSPNMQAMLGKGWVSGDPEVHALLANGEEHFMAGVRDRILRERAGEVFLNRCRKCEALAKTPRAKQCPKCFFSWHDEI